MEQLKVDKFNVTLINLAAILPKIEVKIADDLYSHGLLPLKFGKDTNSLVYHHLILYICNKIKTVDSVYKVVLYDSSLSFMEEHINIPDGQRFIGITLRKFKRLLPINIWEAPYSIKMIKNLLGKDGGERIELEYQLNKLTNSKRKTTYSFSKIQKFGERYGLQFLTKNFFKKIENKQLIIG